MSNDSRTIEVTSVQREPGLARRLLSFKATQIIVLVFSSIEILIAIRFMLKLIGANPESPIVALIYGFSALFLVPFVGMINSPKPGGLLLEVYSLFAIFIYSITAIALEKLIWVIFSRPRGPVTDVVETTTSEHHSIP